MFNKKLICSIFILLFSQPVFPFFTTKTVNAVMGRAPEVSDGFSHSRLFLKIGTEINSLGGDYAIEIPGSLKSADFSVFILPALAASDYHDSDGDSGRVVEKKQAIEWLDDELNVIDLPDNYPIGMLPTLPSKMRLIIELEAQSNFGLPKKSLQPTRLEYLRDITVSSHSGSYDNPANSCLDLYQEHDHYPDGEYWIGTETDKIKTFCDMSNGGFTLIWSYSEKTSYSLYAPLNRMDISLGRLNFLNDMPKNLVRSEDGQINYADYRLNRAMMQKIKSATPAEYKVRITYDPVNVYDPWGIRNYFIARPTEAMLDFIDTSTSFICVDSARRLPVNGKIFGVDFRSENNSYYYKDVTIGTWLICPYTTNTAFTTHWDVGNRMPAREIEGEFPTPDGFVQFYKFNTRDFNNVFGFHGEGEVNHLFGKCSGPTGSDYDFTAKNCWDNGYKVPHSFNNGEGRYLQWYVK